MYDKTVLITGANAGVGFVTARELAKMGARILMAVAIPSAAPALWPAWRQ